MNLNPFRALPPTMITSTEGQAMSKLVKLATEKAARSERDAELLREDLFEKCNSAVDGLGDNVAGFALIVWGKDGEMRTAYNAAQGPIGPGLVPTLAADALNRHVAVMLAKNEEPDDSAS
jgi:hypothetical protein